MTISAKLLALAATKEGIRSVLDIGADVPFSQYPALIQTALDNVVVPDPEPVVPEGNEYIEVIGHADGGLTYKATELALAGNSYELNGDWYYIVKDHPDLFEKILLWDLPEFAGNSSQEVEVAALNGTHLMTADRLVTSKITASLGWDVYPELSIPEEDWVDGEEPEPRLRKFFDQSIGSWDVGNMTSLEAFLFGMEAFNQPIGNWDVSNVTNMESLFDTAASFNQDISRWDVSNVTSMSYMFYEASSFDQDISRWDVSNSEYFAGAFYGASAFNQDISNWKLNEAAYLMGMFENATSFNQDLSMWCTTSSSAPYDFDRGAVAWVKPRPLWGLCVITDQPSDAEVLPPAIVPANEYIDVITHADGGVTYKATDLAIAGNLYQSGGEWFYVATGKSDLDDRIANWYERNTPIYTEMVADNGTEYVRANHIITSRVTDLDSVAFISGRGPMEYFNEYIGSWDTSNVTTLAHAFWGAKNFNRDIGNWDVSKVTRFVSMFEGAHAFNQDITRWDTSQATDMSKMFEGAYLMTYIKPDLVTANVTKISGMLSSLPLFNQDISEWDVSGVVDMSRLFYKSTAFNQDISGWDVSNVTNMDYAFYEANSFNQDLSSWCVTKIPTKPSVFDEEAPGWVLPKPVWGTCPER